MQEPPPLILTLAFDEDTFTRFDGERRRHFPEKLNHIPAHSTLFHHLPGDRERGVLEAITALARTVPPPEVAVTGLRFTGRGVAYVLQSEALDTFRGGSPASSNPGSPRRTARAGGRTSPCRTRSRPKPPAPSTPPSKRASRRSGSRRRP